MIIAKPHRHESTFNISYVALDIVDMIKANGPQVLKRPDVRKKLDLTDDAHNSVLYIVATVCNEETKVAIAKDFELLSRYCEPQGTLGAIYAREGSGAVQLAMFNDSRVPNLDGPAGHETIAQYLIRYGRTPQVRRRAMNMTGFRE